mmetsp:Transcript_31169/g.41237  ORF Transcript_31169/g.41237 Transcript_31169/m.41237 type:complete len:145 (+) Transcript_31169:1164-1598(+)
MNLKLKSRQKTSLLSKIYLKARWLHFMGCCSKEAKIVKVLNTIQDCTNRGSLLYYQSAFNSCMNYLNSFLIHRILERTKCRKTGGGEGYLLKCSKRIISQYECTFDSQTCLTSSCVNTFIKCIHLNSTLDLYLHFVDCEELVFQ